MRLTLEDRKPVGRDIQKVEFSWPLGMPYCRSLGNGLWEERSDLTDGRIGRVIFCVARERMVLLHGFVKKTQKTPAQDLRLALKRMLAEGVILAPRVLQEWVGSTVTPGTPTDDSGGSRHPRNQLPFKRLIT